MLDKKRDKLNDVQTAWFEECYQRECETMLNYAFWQIRNYGFSEGVAESRAHDALQLVFEALWVGISKVMAMEHPAGWLYRVLQNKTVNMIREEMRWNRCVKQLAEDYIAAREDPLADAELRADLQAILTKEEYLLLKRLYADDCTYSDLCREYGLKKSALAMRIRRIKDKAMKKLKK